MRPLTGEDGKNVVRAAQSVTAFAKTTQPTLGTVVARDALFARLDEPSGRSIIWISGPPGSGKTTLAASYIDARKIRSVWFELDADDADPASFFHYLRHAARKLGGAGHRELPAFMPEHNQDVASFARNFFRQLFARATPPFALVLDNAHTVPDGSPLHGALEAGFGQVGKGCRIVVTSRRDPPAALARLRAAGRVTHVTGGDLALAPEEIVAMAAARGQSISAEAAARLFERTQGWAAGLVLLLEHSRFSGDIAETPSGAAPQVIFDYLAGEIFDRFDATTREFLLRIACLPRTTAQVAHALTGEPMAARLLVNLALNDYFVRESPSEGGRIYHFHPLFSEFLRHRAAQALPEATSAAWLERAAALLQQAGQVEDAIALLVDAGSFGEVASALTVESDALLAQGRSETLARWLDLLPPDVLAARPKLLQISGAARAQTRPRAARLLFERAFAGYRERDDRAGMIESACGAIDATIVEFDDVTSLDGAIESLDALLASAAASSPDVRRPRAVATLVLAMLMRDPGHARLEHWLAELEGPAGPGSPAAPPGDAAALATVLAALARADLVAAGTALEAIGTDAGEARPSWALVRGIFDLMAGAPAVAAPVSRQRLASARAEGLRAIDPWLSFIAIAASLLAGDRARARDELRRLDAEGYGSSRGARACIHYLRGACAASGGDTVDALREAKLALAVAFETGVPWLECLARLAVAELQVVVGNRHAAEGQLRSAAAIAERLRSPWLLTGIDVVRAEVARAAQDGVIASDSLRAALRRGREHGLQPPPSLSPPALAELCVDAFRDRVETDYVRALVRSRRLMPCVPPLRERHWPWPFKVITFGGIALQRDGAPIEFSGKGPGRPLELLKVLVALGGRDVRADQLADALWPNAEADYAHNSFTATLHRLRRMLGDDDALVLRDGRLSLDRSLVFVDTWALEQVCDDADASLSGAADARAADIRRRFVDDVLWIYRGPFLPDESEQPGFIACRERMRSRVLRFLARVARSAEEAGDAAAAAEAFQRFIEVDELNEPLHRQLMLCLQRNGELSEGLAVYERLRALLAARSKLMPSPETQALYANMKASA